MTSSSSIRGGRKYIVPLLQKQIALQEQLIRLQMEHQQEVKDMLNGNMVSLLEMSREMVSSVNKANNVIEILMKRAMDGRQQ